RPRARAAPPRSGYPARDARPALRGVVRPRAAPRGRAARTPRGREEGRARVGRGRVVRRTRGPLVAVVVFASLAGCGDREDGGGSLDVEVYSLAADGAIPQSGWALRPEGGGAVVPMRSTSSRGDAGPVFRARGPAGRYAFVGPAPWATVGGPTPVAMEPG